MITSNERVRRAAVIAYHSSPLADPGSGDSGGMTIYVAQLARALARKGVHTDVFTRRADESPRIVRVAEGIRVISIDAGPPTTVLKSEQPAFIDDFVAGVRAFSLSTGIRYDLVHSHYWQSGLAGRRLAIAWDVPLIHSNHTLAKVKNRYLAPDEPPEPLQRIDGERRVIEASDVLVASTDEELEHLACLYGASHDRLKTIYPGVDHSLFRPSPGRQEARAALGLDGEAVLLYVGRIQPLKGLDLAVRATAELIHKGGRDAVLYAIGGPSGPGGDAELVHLRQLSMSLGIGDRVRFLGPRPHETLPAFYSAADVVVVCSHTESFGFAALEAHACGTPVVATAVGGLSHIVVDGGTGYLVHDRDPKLFAARIDTLLSDEPLRAAYSAAAWRRAAAFTWDRSATDFLDLYECLVSAEVPELCSC